MMRASMDLKDKVVVLTGASSGIGRRTAIDLARDGAKVCLVARRAVLLESLVVEIGGEEAGHSVFVCDVSDLEQVRALAAHVQSVHGRCDVLINNAGFSRGGYFQGEATIDAVEAVMRTNYFGTVYCTAMLLPLLEASAPSRVINVASMAGRLAFPKSSSYIASKFAVVGWTESVRFDLAQRGISVGLIEPGAIPTEGFPQDSLTGHPIYRFALGSQESVSKAIRSLARSGRPERVVPRWYYLLQIPKVFMPPVYRFLARRLATEHVIERD